MLKASWSIWKSYSLNGEQNFYCFLVWKIVLKNDKNVISLFFNEMKKLLHLLFSVLPRYLQSKVGFWLQFTEGHRILMQIKNIFLLEKLTAIRLEYSIQYIYKQYHNILDQCDICRLCHVHSKSRRFPRIAVFRIINPCHNWLLSKKNKQMYL